MYKHINNYSDDVTNSYKINKIQNLKQTTITSLTMIHLLKQVIVILMIHTT